MATRLLTQEWRIPGSLSSALSGQQVFVLELGPGSYFYGRLRMGSLQVAAESYPGPAHSMGEVDDGHSILPKRHLEMALPP